MAPSRSVSISLARSSPIEASTTARRDSTTLLRLRSSLMTLNSTVLPSKGDMSFTGRVSSSEPGRKARMPLTNTVRPPLTLPTVPVTKSPDSKSGFSDSHEARRLALSRDRLCRRSRFRCVNGHRHEVAHGTSISPLVVAELVELAM